MTEQNPPHAKLVVEWGCTDLRQWMALLGVGFWESGEKQGVRDEEREEDSWAAGEPEGEQRACLSEFRNSKTHNATHTQYATHEHTCIFATASK